MSLSFTKLITDQLNEESSEQITKFMNSFVVISAKVISICNVFSLSFFLFVKLDDPFLFILRCAINKNIFESKKK